ncbi:MAG TPA: UDP-N-acetylmuramoyl-L-alanyl-D-glutamate--2,6-diaminopimelate ligase [Kineobactrum sp.]
MSSLDQLFPDWAGVPVQCDHLTLDSRQVRPGSLFLAVPGLRHDGRAHIADAIEAGAVAVAYESADGFRPQNLEQGKGAAIMLPVKDLAGQISAIAGRFFQQPSHDIGLVGVTGTNGKTTSSRLLAQLLRAGGRRCGVIGTLGTALDDSVTEAANTTPDPVSLQQQLALWRDDGVDSVSMEASSHALDQGRLNGTTFAIAVFTNLSRDHLDYHGTMAAYGRSKLKLFTAPGLRHAVVNLDDPYAPEVLASLPAGVNAWRYSAAGNPAADVRVIAPRFHTGGVDAQLETPWGNGAFASPLPADFNLANVAAAVTCAVLLGAELAPTLAAVAGLRGIPGRMQLLENTAGLQVVVDYAHTPDALAQVLGALRRHVSGRLLVVFGCGGDRDRSKRAQMGRAACAGADHVILTSDNPRSEDPLAILADIKSGCSGPGVQIQPDRGQAIAGAIALARAGDCVLIAGKGHEEYQIIGAERLPFSDITAAAAALAGRAST